MKKTSFSVLLLLITFTQSHCSLFCTISELINSSGISPECMKQLKVVCNNPDLQNLMHDATSRILTPGMSYSNVIDYGNFPECVSIDFKQAEERILGKFCALSMIVLNIPLWETRNEVFRRINITTDTNKPQKISMEQLNSLQIATRDLLIPEIPFPISKYSMCIPDACTASEVGHFFFNDRLVIPYDNLTIPLVIFPEVLTCDTKESNTELNPEDVGFVVFISVILVLMALSTTYDTYLQHKEKKPLHKILLAFSILFNGKKLLQTSSNKTDQIQVFNGMRFISMAWVIAFHALTVFKGGVISLENYPAAIEFQKHWTNRYLNNAVLAVDTFFFISGFLVAFNYFKKNSNTSLLAQIKEVPLTYVHRYLRLTPSMAMMFFTLTSVFHLFGEGPMWSTIVKYAKKPCTTYWWQFFLYIQNYTNGDDMCVLPSWYLSVDMQLFVLAPIVLIPAAIFAKKYFYYVLYGLIGLCTFWVVCPILLRYYVNGEVGNIYTTHERFCVFLIGITFGMVMRKYKSKPFVFSKVTNFVLWVVTLSVALAFNIYWHDVAYNDEFVKYTLFYGLYRPVWCVCLVFMVYSCYHGYGGIIEWFLSAEIFQVLGKLSYSMYILHFLVELFALSTRKTMTYFSNYMLFYFFCGHLIVTMILSVFWVLAFEYPMMAIDGFVTNLISCKSKAK